ncbi:IS607 family transposase [Pseudoscardovia suis]
MKLSEYAARHGIRYRAAWNRFKAGKIPGAWQDESGTIIVPDGIHAKLSDAAVYARVSDPSEREDQLPAQRKRMEDWAVANGYRVVASVAEVGSGLDDGRRKLTALLKRDDWGTLVVERKDRLTRFGFEWFRLFVEREGRRIVVADEACDDRDDLIRDFVSVIHSFSARLYGRRGSRRARAMAAMVEGDDADE